MSDSIDNRVGFVGVGKVGSRLVNLLLNAGLRVVVYDICEQNVEDMTKIGATRSASIREVGKTCDIVLLSLPNPSVTKEVVIGEAGLISDHRPGLVIVDLSTNSPQVACEIGRQCESHDIGFLDCPVTGGILGTEAGTLTIMAGGKVTDLSKVKPLLKLFAGKIVYAGPQGHGNAIKLIHNMLGEIQVYAIAEAFCLAAKIGIDIESVYEVLSNGMATSRILTELYARKALIGTFEPDATVDMAFKDQKLLIEMAQKASVNLTFSPLVFEKLQELQRRGMGGMDVTAALLLFEEMHQVVVKKLKNTLSYLGSPTGSHDYKGTPPAP